jgi:predicted nucleic acid-binding protein
MFVDSSYLIGLANDNDQHHKRAIELAETVEKNKLMITTLHLSETITGIGSISGGKVSNEILEYILDNYSIVDGNLKLCIDSRDTYLKYDGTLSLADAVAITVMKKNNIYEIVSFDSDFDGKDEIVRIH